MKSLSWSLKNPETKNLIKSENVKLMVMFCNSTDYVVTDATHKACFLAFINIKLTPFLKNILCDFGSKKVGKTK